MVRNGAKIITVNPYSANVYPCCLEIMWSTVIQCIAVEHLRFACTGCRSEWPSLNGLVHVILTYGLKTVWWMLITLSCILYGTKVSFILQEGQGDQFYHGSMSVFFSLSFFQLKFHSNYTGIPIWHKQQLCFVFVDSVFSTIEIHFPKATKLELFIIGLKLYAFPNL